MPSADDPTSNSTPHWRTRLQVRVRHLRGHSSPSSHSKGATSAPREPNFIDFCGLVRSSAADGDGRV